MPNYRGGGRGGKRSQKGKNRRFTDVEELKEQAKKVEKDKEWRRQQGLPSDTESEEEEEEGAAAKPKVPGVDSSSSESESEDDEDRKAKGVSHLIQIENPNRVANKTKKVTELTEAAEGPTLSRKEREEIQKQQAAAHYRKLHNEGKTDEARADLARLAIIRKQREDAAKKKSDAEKVKTAATSAAEQKLLDKKKQAKK